MASQFFSEDDTKYSLAASLQHSDLSLYSIHPHRKMVVFSISGGCIPMNAWEIVNKHGFVNSRKLFHAQTKG
jgi:hypothetical protein